MIMTIFVTIMIPSSSSTSSLSPSSLKSPWQKTLTHNYLVSSKLQTANFLIKNMMVVFPAVLFVCPYLWFTNLPMTIWSYPRDIDESSVWHSLWSHRISAIWTLRRCMGAKIGAKLLIANYRPCIRRLHSAQQKYIFFCGNNGWITLTQIDFDYHNALLSYMKNWKSICWTEKS